MTNFILSLEDTTQQEEDFIVRDISLFLKNRERDDIQVIDIDTEAADTDCLACIHPEPPYDGGILYKQLDSLQESLKEYRKHMQLER